MAIDRLRNNEVILDSNALMMPFQFNLNLESELRRLLGSYEIIIPSTVIKELEMLAEEDLNARSALSFSKSFRIVYVEGETDDSILQLAKKTNAIVVTNDRGLRARLRSERIKTVYLRSRSHLVIE